MTIQLDHVIVPSRQPIASARLLAELLGVSWEASRGEFSPVYVNDSLTVDFMERDQFQRHHLCFRVGDADFDERRFMHVAVFEKDASQIEMRLKALEPHTVRVGALALEVDFETGEEMRTEVSAKFTREQVLAELRTAGLQLAQWWTDPDGDFALLLARPA